MSERVSVGGHWNSSINFAMQQNYVPVIRELVVTNQTDEKLENLDLHIAFDPDFAKEYSYHIDVISPQSSIEISPVKIQTHSEFLFSLTERMVGAITVTIYQGDEKLYEFEDHIELLAFDQWSGLLFMPEVIAAFITPNHPSIVSILHDAAKLLREWSGSPSFTGYQTRNPDQVKKQMAALYTAVQMQGIVYNNPPASYEQLGQRVRLPHVVLEQKQGTCLDLAVLYATCLEAIGLFPLIVFIKGHAFIGCWLEESTFPDCVIDDAAAIEKRIAEGAEELLLVECTDMVAGKQMDFDRALKHGKEHLHDIDDFVCAVDVQRTRGSGIRPIPLRISPNIADDSIADAQKERVNTAAPTTLDSSMLGKVAQGKGQPLTKERVWERKLLDFSLRNALLNFRVTKNALQLMIADMSELEDQLSDGRDFHIMEAPSEWTLSLRDAKMYAIENQRDLIKTIATEEFKSRRIRSFLNEKELDDTLKNLYRSAKTSMEENGSNTLFLALGFLRWFESDLAEKARYAPIVLIPIDIVRSMRNKGYVIRSRQEDAQINITLLEYLRQDFGLDISGLDPLPEDEHGIDLPLILNTIRQAVMGKKRWNIEEMAFIGLFSFGQFVMWNDLRSRIDELRQNKVVSSLIEGRMTWKPKDDGTPADRLSMEDMAVPVSADSSQLASVTAAFNGQSFVLHGPPGTGKSQTITNMIANALYHGKTVLFVAEKMAALSVVQKRLEDIGLDPFCLELHSNKTNKSAVLAQLNKALEVGHIKAPEDYAAVALKVQEMKRQLHDVMAALHETRASGVSLYEAISQYECNASEKGLIQFTRASVSALDKALLRKWDDLVHQYKLATQAIGVYGDHPLHQVGCTSYSVDLRESFKAEGLSLLRQAQSLETDVHDLMLMFNLPFAETKATVAALAELVLACGAQGIVPKALAAAANYEAAQSQIEALLAAGEEYEQLHAQLGDVFEASVFDYAADEARQRWKQADASWVLAKAIGQGKIVKAMKGHAKSPNSITKNNAAAYLDKLCSLAARKRQISDAPAELTALLGDLYRGIQTDWKALKFAVAKATNVRGICLRLPNSDFSSLIGICAEEIPTTEQTARAVRIIDFMKELDVYARRYSISEDAHGDNGSWSHDITIQLEQMTTHTEQLRDMTMLNAADAALAEAGLGCVGDAYKKGVITPFNMENAYHCSLNYELALSIISRDERLKRFHGRSYDDLIRRYRETLDEHQRLTIQELVARLSAKIPASGAASAATSELGILKRAIKSNGRMLSLRKLFEQIPNLIRKLCPCMLMSPISVAQYIDPSFPKFDLVIFDEASQLPTSEAVGAIARGDEVVIVGDPKQLPPTNFFSSNRMDEENGTLEDLESLLDDCLAISMPQEHLKWHYRSRHESLIAYSNMKYYDNQLYTFPSPNDLVSEVRMIHLDGFYDKGKTKQNMAEAKAIVSEIIRRLSDEQLRHDSIGVVTFSSAQQNLIDDLLSEEWARHPALEEFDRNSHEPIFIKNLENVQGDERDVILFSVGYAPDQNGQVSMNFGPLNRDGGWRRLNVAISRARKSMTVYSVLRPEQIDLSRTRSEGVAGLKGFLEFAERGKTSVAQRSDLNAVQNDALVEEIGKAISSLGYEVRCKIGCSHFKLDIGIVNPKRPETYLLGILLDSRDGNGASAARDRFVLQPDVLTGLGWRVMRIWTLDWFDDSARVLKDIQTTLETLPADEPSVSSRQSFKIFNPHAFEQDQTAHALASACMPYCSADVGVKGTAEDYYLPKTTSRIRDVIVQIMNSEAPISRKLLMRKVLAAWTINRGGSRVERIFSDALTYVPVHMTTDEDRVFVWNPNQDPAGCSWYRAEDQNGSKRSMEDIPSEEIMVALLEVLREQIALSQEDLIRETARKFGFARVGGQIGSTVSYVILSGLNNDKLKKDDNQRIIINE